MPQQKYQAITESSDHQHQEEERLVEADTMAQVSNIPSTYSSQQLMNNQDGESIITDLEDTKSLGRRSRENGNNGFRDVSSKEWFTVAVLCFINLINYMDRFTIAGKFNLLRIILMIQSQSKYSYISQLKESHFFILS